MLLSVVTVVKNREKYIERALRSISEQKEKSEFEYIVKAAPSRDGTLEIIQKYRNVIDNLIVSEDMGMYYALNDAIEAASGKYVGILHSDDFYCNSNVLSDVLSDLENSDVDVVHYDGIFISEESESCKYEPYYSTHSTILDTPRSILHPACFVKKDALLRCGLYDVRYKSASDYDLMIKLKLRGASYEHFTRYLVYIENASRDRVSYNCYSNIEAFLLVRRNGIGRGYRYIRNYMRCSLTRFVKRALSLMKINNY